MKLRYRTIYFFAFVASMWLYVNVDIEVVDPSYASAVQPNPDLQFEMQVGKWSEEINAGTPTPPKAGGNCLPVAMELQKRIVDTGRIAFVAVVDKDVLPTRHAMVVYSSKVAGRLDSVIDNGSATFNKVVPKDFLDTGVFGTYLGTCKDPDPTQGLCGHVGLAW
jgi:hypothetical protein